MRKVFATKVIFISMFLLYIVYISIRIFSTQELSPFLLLTSGIYLLLATSLFYLAYFDFSQLEVHNLVSFIIMIGLLILNIVLFKTLGPDANIQIVNNFSFDPTSNFLSALILGSIFLLIVLLTREKGLGQGDVRIAIIVGLLIGLDNIIPWLYITIFSALFYGFILAKEKKTFRGIQIPFVPFMILGVIILTL